MEKLIELFKETLEIEDHDVKMEDKFRDYEEWDSLAVLAILAMINEEYDIVIPRKDFENMVTVKDIFLFLENK